MADGDADGVEADPAPGGADAGPEEAGAAEGTGRAAEDSLASVPEWDDDYLDRVSDRLLHSYDLERDHAVGGRRFDLYGSLRIESHKQFFHPALNYANHETRERLYVRRVDDVRVADVDALVDLGHELGEAIDADETHQGTDFTFGLVAPEIPDEVRSFVEGFRDRTLIRYGYYGHYEVALFVVAPDRESLVASPQADVATAFALWEDVSLPERRSFLDRVRRLFGR